MLGMKRRRTLIRWISFAAAAFVTMAGVAVNNYIQASAYRTSMNNSYQRALSELSVHVNNIDLELQKGIYAGTPTQMVGLSAQIWRDSGAAKAALEQLPLSNTRVDNTYKFISQVGDFVNSMSREIAFSQKIQDSDRVKMMSLSTYAKNLSTQLGNMMDEFQQGNLNLTTTQKMVKNTANANGAQPTVDTGFKDIENNFSSMPALIYDGPFSDNVVKKAPDLTKGKKAVSEKDAAKKAAAFLGVAQQSLTYSGQTDGNLPTYNFNTDTAAISVSKSGGYIVRMLDSRSADEAKLTNEQALVKARQYMKNIGLSSMKESYYQTNNNICVINYAYSQNGVICYSDLVKIGISLADGKMLSFDATGYIMNHKNRGALKPQMSVKSVQGLLSSELKVDKVSLAVIPMEDTAEALCYEFKCTGKNGQTVLDYYDAKTGKEDQILILLKTPGGYLAI